MNIGRHIVKDREKREKFKKYYVKVITSSLNYLAKRQIHMWLKARFECVILN